MKNTTIYPAATAHYHNGEAAKQGEASDTLNLRERENALEVIGTPAQVATINAGARLLAIDGERYICLIDNTIKWGTTVLATVEGQVLNACIAGQFLIVATTEGYICLHRTASGYDRLNPHDAIPLLHLCAVGGSATSIATEAYSFKTPMDRWQSPLPAADLAGMAEVMRKAWQSLTRQTTDSGQLSRPMLVRYGVRLWDDSYMWLSAPVVVGDGAVKSNHRASVEAIVSDGKFVAIPATTLTLPCYRLGITVAKGIDSKWASLVKSIDILATDEADTVNCRQLDYRMSTTNVGERRYVFEFGPSPRGLAGIKSDLLATSWQVIASCSDIDSLNRLHFTTSNTAVAATSALPGATTYVLTESLTTGITVNNATCSAVNARNCATVIPHSAMCHNGRLYTGGLSMRLKHPWHPLQLFAGTVKTGNCTVTTQLKIATEQGMANVVRTDELNYIPTAINPLLATADARTASMRIEIAAGGTVRVLERELWPHHESGQAVAFASDLHPHEPASGMANAVHDSGLQIRCEGEIEVSATANPFACTRHHCPTGTAVLAMAVANRPIYSGGFGRYPIYVFSDQGIFALPQLSSGAYGEARLLSRKILAHGFMPVEGGDKVWFKSRLGQLCSVSGATVTLHLNACKAQQLAWNDAENELCMLDDDGKMQVLMSGGRTSRLSLTAKWLFHDHAHALAITHVGGVLDLRQEIAGDTTQSIHWLSLPAVFGHSMNTAVKRLIWNIFSRQVDLHLTLRGCRGEGCHGFIIDHVHVRGNLNAPLALPIIAQPYRSLRLEIEGTAPSGALLRQVVLG